MTNNRSRLKRAELLSTVGAAVLGGGIALILQEWLLGFAIPIMIIGLLVHSWGMFDKHRIERDADVRRASWENYLYWLCWVVLALLSGYVIFRPVT